jgi:hypothetical protein
MSALTVLVLVALSVVGLAGAAGPLPASAGLAGVTVSAAADTYVVAEQPASAHGAEARMTAANWAAWHSEAYVRFDVAPAPGHRPIVSARVEFAFQRLDRQPTLVELRVVDGAWDEMTTYAGRPAVGGMVASAVLPGSDARTLSFDVTASLRAAGSYSFALINHTAESVAAVHSREHGPHGPRLVVEYGSPPLCGAAFNVELTGETYQQALARVDGYYDGLESVRVFYPGLPAPWPGKLDTSGRPMIVSFKASPADVVAGVHDARLDEWFRTAPRDQDIFWTYFHEPEDDVEGGAFTAAVYRQAWQRLSGLARQAGNPRLRATLILMGWTVDPASGRDWRDFYPGRDAVDVVGWDVYNAAHRHGRYRPPAEMFARVIAASRSEGLPFGIAETGSGLVADDDGTGRAGWLRQLAEHLSEAGALFVDYFDLDWSGRGGVDYRLRDPASMSAWREFCS